MLVALYDDRSNKGRTSSESLQMPEALQLILSQGRAVDTVTFAR
jgi:hypothetical protein